ncbi:unnamed protein product [Amoebophrya sp. A25]|nr:unnamed protein product [Amoebophrya sp. A25]|eukprot:GSA25T00001586001.1
MSSRPASSSPASTDVHRLLRKKDEQVPWSVQEVADIADRFGTPLHVYDETTIRGQCGKLKATFGGLNKTSYMNYFAVKATPTPAILKLMKAEGFGADCSSMAELLLAERCGFQGEEIMFTSNNTPSAEFKQAMDLGAIVNFDDITHLEFLEKEIALWNKESPKKYSFPELVSFRFNPGPLRTGNAIIGDPKEAKYGLSRKQLLQAYAYARDTCGASRFGLHTMVVSNCLKAEELVQTAHMLFELCLEIKTELGIDIEMINLGGGVGIQYDPRDGSDLDLARVRTGLEKAYQEWNTRSSGLLSSTRIVTECGRFVTAPGGYLLARMMHGKRVYKNYVGLDACMANLMRPGMYGAYHHITCLPMSEPITLPRVAPSSSSCSSTAVGGDSSASCCSIEDVAGVSTTNITSTCTKTNQGLNWQTVNNEEEMNMCGWTASASSSSSGGSGGASASSCSEGCLGPVLAKISEALNKPKFLEQLIQPGARAKTSTTEGSASDKTNLYDVTGGLCENNDKFAIDRYLPVEPKVGDLFLIHDAGAHGHSMGFNYNGKLRSAEVLVKKEGPVLIRRAETHQDLFACIEGYYGRE